MSTLGGVIDVLVNNRADLEDAISKLGGIDALIRAAPDLVRIAATLQGTGQTPAAAAQVLAYSAATAARVKAFQSAHGLTADGIVGDETWTEVEKLIGGPVT